MYASLSNLPVRPPSTSQFSFDVRRHRAHLAHGIPQLLLRYSEYERPVCAIIAQTNVDSTVGITLVTCDFQHDTSSCISEEEG